MATRIDAYLAADGSMHPTEREADDHDLRAALIKWAESNAVAGLPFDKLACRLVADWHMTRRELGADND